MNDSEMQHLEYRLKRLRQRAGRANRRRAAAAERLLEERTRELFLHNKALEKAVSARTRELVLTLTNMSHGIVMLDSSGEISVSNTQAAELLELGAGASLAEELAAIIEKIDWDFKPAFDNCQPGARRDIQRQSGRYLEFTRTALKDLGEVITISDITVMKRRQHELEDATRAANSASIAKSKFLSTMSHEIRTPLNGVLGAIELLQQSPLNSSQQKLISIASSSGEALLSLVTDILDLAKLDRGIDTLDLSPVDFTAVVESACRIITPLAAKKGIWIDVKGLPAHSGQILCDGWKLQQVLINLLSNAVKFSEGGFIKIVVQSSQLENEKTKITCEVCDSGFGISREDQKNIFNEFWQVDKGYNRGVEGTGLGLAISRKIVERMGGTIGVNSEPGKGATFHFTIPFAAAPITDLTATASQPYHETFPTVSTHRNILLVEDNETNSIVASQFLRQAGHNVSLASDGDEAVTFAMAIGFDLILMDISMPGLDGTAATNEIRTTNGPNKKTPIIALTAHASSADRCHFLALGMQDCITKPIRRSTLLQVIEKVSQSLPGSNIEHNTSEPDGVIDVRSFQEFAVEVGEKSFPRIVTNFLKQIGDADVLLSELSATRDVERLQKLAHALAGTASTLCATKLADVSSQVEAACKQSAELSSLTTDLRDAMTATSIALRSLSA